MDKIVRWNALFSSPSNHADSNYLYYFITMVCAHLSVCSAINDHYSSLALSIVIIAFICKLVWIKIKHHRVHALLFHQTAYGPYLKYQMKKQSYLIWKLNLQTFWMRCWFFRVCRPIGPICFVTKINTNKWTMEIKASALY